jgi:hypothetical protein
MATALPTSQQIDLRGNAVLVTEIIADKVSADSTTATLSSNAATITKYAAKITTEALTTAHTATATLVITLSGVAAGDLAFAQLAGGTNTAGLPIIDSVVTTTNTVTIKLKNQALTTNAFNGTFIINLLVLKA